MKKIIGLIVFTLFAGYVFAQDINQSNVPAIVLNAFQLKFPNASDVDWKLEKGKYRVNFEVNNKDHQLIIDDKGKLLKLKQELWVSEIPKEVLGTMQSKVTYFDLNDATKFEEGGEVVYEINFENGDEDYDFLISGNGKLIKYERELRDTEIPVAIATFVKNKYGDFDIDNAKYTEESGKITYYLEGEITDMDNEFWFDDKNQLLKHKQDLRNSEIPALVTNAAVAGFSGFEIRDADLTEEGANTTYELELRKSKEKVRVTFNSGGKILKTTKN